MRFRTRIRREGKAMKIYIPKEVWESLNLKVGDEIDVIISVEPTIREELEDIRQRLEELEDRVKALEEGGEKDG